MNRHLFSWQIVQGSLQAVVFKIAETPIPKCFKGLNTRRAAVIRIIVAARKVAANAY